MRGSGRRKGRGARRSQVVVRLEFVCRKEDSICSATSSPVNRTCDFEHPRDRVPLSSEILGAKRVLEGGIKIVQHLVEPPTWPTVSCPDLRAVQRVTFEYEDSLNAGKEERDGDLRRAILSQLGSHDSVYVPTSSAKPYEKRFSLQPAPLSPSHLQKTAVPLPLLSSQPTPPPLQSLPTPSQPFYLLSLPRHSLLLILRRSREQLHHHADAPGAPSTPCT